MNINNVEQVKELLKRKDSIDSFLKIMADNPNCSLLMSVRAENSQGRFVFLDSNAAEDARVMLFDMENRIEEQLSTL